MNVEDQELTFILDPVQRRFARIVSSLGIQVARDDTQGDLQDRLRASSDPRLQAIAESFLDWSIEETET